MFQSHKKVPDLESGCRIIKANGDILQLVGGVTTNVVKIYLGSPNNSGSANIQDIVNYSEVNLVDIDYCGTFSHINYSYVDSDVEVCPLSIVTPSSCSNICPQESGINPILPNQNVKSI